MIKESKTAPQMLEWQYRSILAELQQLQLHASDPSCPCSQAEIGEWCIPKHALSLASLAGETAAMDSTNAELFEELSEAATELHEKTRAALCHKADAPDVVSWSRDWRKKVEPLYYSCKVKLQQAPPLCRLPGKSRDILVRGHYIGSVSNPKLYQFLKDSIRELARTVAHRRGIIQGYHKVNLDALVREGQITEAERIAANHILDKAYDAIGATLVPKVALSLCQVPGKCVGLRQNKGPLLKIAGTCTPRKACASSQLVDAATLEAIRRPIPKEQLPFDLDRPWTVPVKAVVVPATEAKPATKYTLFPYQAEGVAWLKGRPYALLADDMGLGKTPQAIHWGADNRPVLVVVPAALTFNWQREIQSMWRPGDTAIILDGKQGLPKTLPDWTILSYGQLNQYLPQLKRAGFQSLIVDESHFIKNLSAQRTKNVLELVAPLEPGPGDKPIRNRLAVTGTPVLNRPIELFALLVFLGVWRDHEYRRFRDRYTEHKIIKGRTVFTGAKNLGELHNSLKSFMLRRLKKDVLKQLPPKIITPLYVAISNRDEYIEAERNFLTWLAEKAGDIAAINASRAEIITKMNALRQLAAMGKVMPVCDWLKPCKDGQGKVIVFSTFNAPLEGMARCKPDSVVYNGALSSLDRQAIVDKFQLPSGPCYFLGTVGAAGVGITLTAASRVCFLDLPWTPGGKTQAEDRAHRIGQMQSVEIVNVLARGTIDERMLKLLADKEFIIAQAVDGKALDEARSTSISQSLMEDFLRGPTLLQNAVQYQPDPVDPDPEELAEVAEGFRQDKKPWQMTKEEFIRLQKKQHKPLAGYKGKYGRYDGSLQFVDERFHKNKVRQALKEGKSVPAEVLKDYPDLVKPAPTKTQNAHAKVSISGKCGTTVESCTFTLRRRGKPHKVTKEVTETPATVCKAATVGELARRTRELLAEGKCSAKLRQEPSVKIAGTCTTAGCSLKVKGAIESFQTTDTKGLPGAISDVIGKLEPRGIARPTSRTFAPGITTSTRYEFEFKVVEADSLIVSHSPYTFEINPEYTAKIQPRIRERLANQLQVKTIAARLDPEKLLLDTKAIDTGTPIIGPDNLVECGNGRVMALMLAAKEYPANIELYRIALKSVALDMGLPVAQIDKMKLPVLVRLRLTPVDRQAFAEECNARPTIETSSIEKARTDADKITPAMLGSLDVLEGEAIEKALRSERNKAFVAAYLSKVAENERAGLMDARGYLSSDGIRRMVMGIFAATFKGKTGLSLASKFFEAIDETGVKNAFNGILRSLGIMAQAENLVASGARETDLTFGEDLARTMEVFSNLRGADMSVADYLAQVQLFERQLSPFQETVLKALDQHARSAKRIGNILTYYAQAVIDSAPPSQVQMIPGPKPDKAVLFTQAVKRVGEEAEAEKAEREAKKQKEPVAAMGCGLTCLLQGYEVIRRKLHKCNLSEHDFNMAMNYRPLRNLLATAIGWKGTTVELCSVGMVPGVYQVTFDGLSISNDLKVLNIAMKTKGMKQVYTKVPGQRVYEVVVPEVETARELTWSPQEIIRIPAKPQGVQPAMFQQQPKPRWCSGLKRLDKDMDSLYRRLTGMRDKVSSAKKNLDVPLNICAGQTEMFAGRDAMKQDTHALFAFCDVLPKDMTSMEVSVHADGSGSIDALVGSRRVVGLTFEAGKSDGSVYDYRKPFTPEYNVYASPELKQDPILIEIGKQICGAGMCSNPSPKAKKPIGTATEQDERAAYHYCTGKHNPEWLECQRYLDRIVIAAKGYSAKSAKPICTPPQAKKLESCILDIKARNVEVGCKPEGTGSKKCPKVFAVCSASIGCRNGRRVE